MFNVNGKNQVIILERKIYFNGHSSYIFGFLPFLITIIIDIIKLISNDSFERSRKFTS